MEAKQPLYLAGAFTAALVFADAASAKPKIERGPGSALAGQNVCKSAGGRQLVEGNPWKV